MRLSPSDQSAPELDYTSPDDIEQINAETNRIVAEAWRRLEQRKASTKELTAS
jgi:hypothetical protein